MNDPEIFDEADDAVKDEETVKDADAVIDEELPGSAEEAGVEEEGAHAEDGESEAIPEVFEETPEEIRGEAQDAPAEETPAEETPVEATPAPEKKDKNGEQSEGLLSFIYDILELTAISLAAVMIILTLFMRHSPVRGSSMYPTIMGRSEGGYSENVGKDVLLISNLFYTPKTGDIVVIQTPTLYPSSAAASMDHAIVKRVIAVGGDTMKIDFANWRIWINGEVFEDGYGSAPYVNYPSNPEYQMRGFSNTSIFDCPITYEDGVYTMTIPEGMLFVMGDNRNNSNDSRMIGLIDERWVVGKELLRIYPFDRFGTVD